MSREDAVQVPALPDRVRSVRWGYYAVRVLLVAVLLAVAGVLPGGPRTPERYRYREGEIARERVIAPYDFRVEKDEIALRREQQSAAAAVPPVYMVDARASSDLLTRMGVNSRAVITGDITQIDLKDPESSGLVRIQSILGSVPDVRFVYFHPEDVVRHRLVRDIIRAFDSYHARLNGTNEDGVGKSLDPQDLGPETSAPGTVGPPAGDPSDRGPSL